MAIKSILQRGERRNRLPRPLWQAALLLLPATVACGQATTSNAQTTARPFTVQEVAEFSSPWAIDFLPGNLMDLTHETFVHGSSIGQRAVAEAPFVATHGDRTATVTRWMENIDAPPFWGGQLFDARGYGGNVDRWQIIKFEAPCTVSIDVGVAEAGTGAVPPGGNQGDVRQSNRSKGVNGFVLNTVTPETDATCHYFWAFARNYSLGDQRLTHQLREGVASIFREDELILEAQQKAMDKHPDHQFYNLNIDAGSMWARRLIDGLVARETPAHAVVPIRQVG